jgi:predicted Zn-dependent protease
MARHVRYVRRKRKVTPQGRERIIPDLPIALIAGAVLVALIVGFLTLHYGPSAYRSWRESGLLHRAHTMLAQQHFDEASNAAQEALDLHPDSLVAFQILAEATEKQNRPETVTWRAQIARLLPGNLDAQLNLASAALRFGQLDVARHALENIAPEDRDTAAFHVVAGWLARAEGNEVEVEKHFAAAVKRDPTNDLYQFNLAVLQIRSDDSEKSATGRSTLEGLAKTAAFRSGALRALLSDAVQQRDFERAGGFAQDLQMSQQVTFADYLLCLDLYRKLDEKKFSALLERVKPVAARNAGDLALLMDWMNNNGLAPEVLRWMEKLTLELTAKPPPAISVGDAFIETKNWSRLKRWTRSGSWADYDYLRLAYQAFAAHQSRQAGADAEFSSLWHSAEHAGYDRPERELNLARLATKWNLPLEAEKLWEHVAKNPEARREGLDALYRIYRSANDVRKLREVLERLHENSPNEPAISANLARLALNVDQNTKFAQDLAKEAYDRAPQDVNCAVTYAYSLYSLGRTTEGVEILRKLPADQLRDPHAAVYVALLLLDENQTDEAKQFIEAARRGPLFAEEKKLLEEGVAKTSGAVPSPSPGATPKVPPISLATPFPGASSTPKSTPASTAAPARELPLPDQP